MNNLKIELDANKQYQEKLFSRGYLITEKNIEDESIYPLYNNWNYTKFSKYNVYVHKYQNYYTLSQGNIEILLIGHAYDPINMIEDENELLKNCITYASKSKTEFFNYIDNISGVFVILLIDNDTEYLVQDCCGIMTAYYGDCNGTYYISSHAQLVADIEGLEMDKKIREYIEAQFYKIGIRQLCGVKSPFKELKMLTSNTFLNISTKKVTRFYPSKPLTINHDNIYEKIENILKSSIDICSKKWNCSISLTGGVDSKMTLASANGKYDKFKYFSFISSEAEKKDAEAAKNICEKLGINHEIFNIPEKNEEINSFEILSQIEEHNLAHIWKFTPQEMRKILYLNNYSDIQVEIKSHVNEVGRAFYYKKLGKKKFKFPLTSRDMSNLAKRNFFNRKILKEMDKSFDEFKQITEFNNLPKGYDECDMFYWENRMSAWASLVKQSFDISHETIIIYNNIKLIELFLNFNL